MRRAGFILLACSLVLVMLNLGCTGDQGPAGPPGDDGTDASPRPIKLLLAGVDTQSERLTMIQIALRDRLFPIGTEINTVSLRDSTPTLGWMSTFDVILVWTNGLPLNPTLLGDRLADYADMGGGVVLAQFCFTDRGLVTGRITSPGYAPLKRGPASLNIADRTIDFFSLDFPLHPIFHGADVFDVFYCAQPDFSSPELDPSAKVIALDNFGEYAIAINKAGNVMGLNMFGGWWFADPQYSSATQVIANCCLFVADSF